MRLVCVCPNPALDHTVVVPSFAGGKAVRPIESHTAAGGKGLNVARFASGFGAQTTAITWLGETGADFMLALARQDNLDLRATIAPGTAVRVCPVVLAPSEGRVLAVSDRGPVVDSVTWADFVDLAAAAASHADTVCVSGSFPRVEGVDPVQSLLSVLESAAPLWVDTSGSALASVAELFPSASLKVNLAEAGELVASVIPSGASPREQALTAAEALGGVGRDAVVTAGPAGAASSTAAGLRWQDSPRVSVANPTASGDAFMAGYLCAGRVALWGLSDPLKAGVLAGAANAGMRLPAIPAESIPNLLSALDSSARDLADPSLGADSS